MDTEPIWRRSVVSISIRQYGGRRSPASHSLRSAITLSRLLPRWGASNSRAFQPGRFQRSQRAMSDSTVVRRFTRCPGMTKSGFIRSGLPFTRPGYCVRLGYQAARLPARVRDTD